LHAFTQDEPIPGNSLPNCQRNYAGPLKWGQTIQGPDKGKSSYAQFIFSILMPCIEVLGAHFFTELFLFELVCLFECVESDIGHKIQQTNTLGIYLA
jgi:hypothetical protein